MGHYDKFEEKKKQEQRDIDNSRVTTRDWTPKEIELLNSYSEKKQEYDALKEQRGFFDAAMQVQEDNRVRIRVDKDGTLSNCGRLNEYDLTKELTQEDSDWAELPIDEWGDHELKEPEFDDQYLVLEMGAKKHGVKNWLEPNGSKSSHKDMHASMFRHLAESSVGKTKDDESGLHPLLHLATRALMVYTRQQRGIVHEDDVVDTKYTLDDVLHALDETIDSIGNSSSAQESIDTLWKGLEGATIMLEEMRGDTE